MAFSFKLQPVLPVGRQLACGGHSRRQGSDSEVCAPASWGQHLGATVSERQCPRGRQGQGGRGSEMPGYVKTKEVSVADFGSERLNFLVSEETPD